MLVNRHLTRMKIWFLILLEVVFQQTHLTLARTALRHASHLSQLARGRNLVRRAISEGNLPEPEPELNRGNNEELTALKALDKLLKKYDRRSTPTNDQGVPTNVSCQLFVASLSSINTENMDYVTDAYLRQKWSDPRLSHEDIKTPLDLADPNLVKAIWKPEVYFPNAKEANFQFVTVPNVLIRIHPGGEILYILRLSLKFSCMMELSRYPLDTQVCAMQISSFSKTTKELLLNWDRANQEMAVSVAKDLRMPQFEMQKITTSKCHEENHMGNYSCLVATFHLHRSIGFHLIQSYLPSILIVSISWVSFWMDVDCVPARVTLGVITLLTVSSQVSGTSVPQTSYVKAIDVWMGVCTAFVFAALVEFTCVNYLWRRNPRPFLNFDAAEQAPMMQLDQIENNGSLDHDNIEMNQVHSTQSLDKSHLRIRANHLQPDPDGLGCLGTGQPISRSVSQPANMDHKVNGLDQIPSPRLLRSSIGVRKNRLLAVRIDEVCRFVFPLGFALFNAMYWTYYKEHEITNYEY